MGLGKGVKIGLAVGSILIIGGITIAAIVISKKQKEDNDQDNVVRSSYPKPTVHEFNNNDDDVC
jgi:hypothetical protein